VPGSASPVLRRWPYRWLFIVAIALAVLALAAWRPILAGLGEFLVSPQTPQPADLILVLGGDFYGARVIEGANLAVESYAPLVLISGTMYGARPEGVAAIQFLTARGYPRRLFQSFLQDASSTIGEALALRGELARRGVKRVLLVTSAYHSRRASIVFRLFCPGIRFITIGAPDEHYHPRVWWEDPSSRRLFFSEWTKIFGTVLFEYPKYLIERLPG